MKKLIKHWLKYLQFVEFLGMLLKIPFFIETLKEMNPSYNPPTRELLSGRIFEQQLSRVNNKVTDILSQQKNLTLGM